MDLGGHVDAISPGSGEPLELLELGSGILRTAS